jgi:hypothetical protein
MKRLFAVAVFSLVLFGATRTSFADPIVFFASLTGAAESPPVPTVASGFTFVTIDPVLHTMRVQVTFANLTQPSTVAHIHAPTTIPFDATQNVGVATTTPTFPGFPPGVTSGSFDMTFNMTLASSYNSAFVTANGGSSMGIVNQSVEDALFAAIMSGRAYLNVHSTFRPGGEIRGFLAPVPEPATMLLFGLGLGGVALRIRRGRKAK